MRRRSAALFILTGAILCSRNAYACFYCMDEFAQVCRTNVPFVGSLTTVFLVWVAGALALKLIFRKQVPKPAAHMPSWLTLAFFLLIGIALVFGIVASWSLHSIVGLLAVPVWLVWFVWLVVRAIVTRLKPVQSRPEKAFRSIYLVSILAAVLAVAYGCIERHSISGMVSRLDYHCPSKVTTLLPELVARGRDATPALIAACKETLSWSDSGHTCKGSEDFVMAILSCPVCLRSHRKHERLYHALYCLGRIGGPEAKAFLEGVVRREVTLEEGKDASWHKAACLAYAECGGENAVPDLKAVFSRSRTGKAIPLMAMTKGASRAGVEFALDHIEVLSEEVKKELDSHDSWGAWATTEAVLHGESATTLRQLPLYRCRLKFGVKRRLARTDCGFLAEFYWDQEEYFSQEERSKMQAIANIGAEEMRQLVSAARKRWGELLE